MREIVDVGEIEVPMEPLSRHERAYELLKELQNGSARRYDVAMGRFVEDPSLPIPVRPTWWERARDILGDDFLEPGDL
jgi:hypothetical protein